MKQRMIDLIKADKSTDNYAGAVFDNCRKGIIPKLIIEIANI